MSSTHTNKSKIKFDPNFTQHVIDTMGPNVTPRNREVFGALFKHIHDFTREVELTTEEWMAGVHFLNSVGQISTPIRNEMHRMSDIVGLESLVDEIAHYHALETEGAPTSSAILGPFWSPNAPFRELGGTIIQDGVPPNGQVTLMHGTVSDLITHKPIPNAVFDIWQASANGKYDFQDPENQTPNNLRGKFRTDENGKYYFYCLHPTAYSLPTDGPAGVMLRLLDRHPMRPAHIHLMVSHNDYKSVTTQIYPKDDPYVKTDTVFAVKPDLLVDFKPSDKDSKATLDLEYNVVLCPKNTAPIKEGAKSEDLTSQSSA